MTNQSDRQADARSATGKALTYEGDTLAYFDQQGIAGGEYNGRLLAWINQALAANYTEINGAKAALAAAGGSPTWDGLNLFGGAAGVTGDAYVNFATMSNGAPTTAATGQPIIRIGATTGIVAATVSNGALVAADSGQATTAAYTAWRLPEEVKSYYADVSFGDANDAIGLIVAGDIGSIGNTAIHNIFTNNSWSLQYYSSGVQTVVQGGSFTAIPSGQKRRVGWRISGSDFYFLNPDGTEAGPITSAPTKTRNNQCAIFEHFRSTTGTPGAKIYAVATNLFANPTAAGRANLLLNQNNLTGGAWSTTMSGYAAGQADAAGGTLGERLMEVAASQNQYFYQLISKAAAQVRYTQRFKVKMIGRDWGYIYSLNGTTASQALQYVNLTTNTPGTLSGTGFSQQSCLIYPLGNGWCQVQQDFLSDTDTGLYSSFGLATADGTGIYVGDVTKGMIVYDEWLYARPT